MSLINLAVEHIEDAADNLDDITSNYDIGDDDRVTILTILADLDAIVHDLSRIKIKEQ